MKICSQCGIGKDIDQFFRNAKAPDGRRSNCKMCQNVRSRIWAAKNSERVKTTRLTYRARDDVKLLRCQYEKNRRRKNPVHNLFKRVERRCREIGIPFYLREEDVVIPWLCPVLGIELSQDGTKDQLPTIDRIDPNGVYSKENIIVMSMRANRIKNDASLDELKKIILFLERLYEREHS